MAPLFGNRYDKLPCAAKRLHAHFHVAYCKIAARCITGEREPQPKERIARNRLSDESRGHPVYTLARLLLRRYSRHTGSSDISNLVSEQDSVNSGAETRERDRVGSSRVGCCRLLVCPLPAHRRSLSSPSTARSVSYPASLRRVGVVVSFPLVSPRLSWPPLRYVLLSLLR